MFKKSILVFVLLLFTSIVLFNNEIEANDDSKNPYVSEYLKNEVSNYSIAEEPLTDVESEKQLIIKTLEEYYTLDLQVVEILENYIDEDGFSEKITSTERQDKIEVMEKIIEIYKSVKKEESKILLTDYIDRYVYFNDENNIKIIEFLDNVSLNKEEVSLLAAYDGNSAGNWAYNNWNSYRRDYPKFTGDFGTDCTNFVSQALHIGGGKPKSGDWTISRKNLTYWEIDSASELDYSWYLTDPSPWISVKEFRNYWRPKSNVSSYTHDYYEQNHEDIYNGNIYKGDVVVFHKGIANFLTIPTHLMIISRYDSSNKDFLLAGHTNNRQAYPLLDAIDSYSQIEFLKIN